ncbi:SgcJ/EcaC family oxidoreductase, partial [Erysipelatoclostridium ramosum]|uniref:SgcJ/EcaC family oxidoreductase n=1 Tax=Thomasclavelia ramosa TaxID=1547 RepID=UPI001D0775EA
VRRIVDELGASWNAGDAERMYRFATDDIEWVNIMGMYWRGKAQVQAAHHAVLTTRYKGVGETLEEIESLRAIGDGAVLAV